MESAPVSKSTFRPKSSTQESVHSVRRKFSAHSLHNDTLGKADLAIKLTLRASYCEAPIRYRRQYRHWVWQAFIIRAMILHLNVP
jgi:hypothetical protein